MHRGELIAQAASFQEDLVILDPLPSSADAIEPAAEDDTEAAYRALVLGTRDYVRESGISKVLVALSGGIDSALVAAIATEALGAENVLGIGMPSPYSSSGSIDDSRKLAANLGIRFEVIGISELFRWSLHMPSNRCLPVRNADTTEENIQPRIRATLLMALSNKFSALVLTTGNKSEMAVGYCTLYGDMAGALAVVGDLVKTRLYAVCHWLNREREVIPAAHPGKAALGRTRPGQKDTDSLPPYEVLDPILEAYVERYETPECIAEGKRISAGARPTSGAPGRAVRVQTPAGRAGAEGYAQIVWLGAQIPHRRQSRGLNYYQEIPWKDRRETRRNRLIRPFARFAGAAALTVLHNILRFRPRPKPRFHQRRAAPGRPQRRRLRPRPYFPSPSLRTSPRRRPPRRPSTHFSRPAGATRKAVYGRCRPS